ncbi:MAG: LytR C-terminal domain-containing protein [Gaiellales bacterium]
MTMIDLDTSPLQAAREWRGISTVAAAMSSGLTLAQAEALEEGDPSVFGSIDEMIASAVVYGASIGIGRDEATALLDRTVTRAGVQVQLPDVAAEDPRPGGEFSGAVQERSARIADRSSSSYVLDPIEDFEMTEIELACEGSTATSFTADASDVIDAIPGPTPEQAVAASGEIHLDDVFGPEGPWERSGGTGELAAWIDDRDEFIEPADHRTSGETGLGVRIGDTLHTALERIIGSDRADAVADRFGVATDRVGQVTRAGRERLRRSEHATLFVAIGGGALLIALVVAIGGALGGSGTAPEKAAPKTDVTATAAGDTVDPVPATGTAGSVKPAKAKAKAGAGPMVAPAKITVDVFNAGSKKGYAKEVAAKLKGAGYQVGEVTNAKDYTSATIIHPKGMAREARVLARRTGVTSVKESPGTGSSFTIVVT